MADETRQDANLSSGRWVALVLLQRRPDSRARCRKPENWYHNDEVMHLRGLGFDGVQGYSVISLARQALQMASNAEGGTKFYENGARPGLVLTSQKLLSDKAYERLKSSWEARHQGVENAHKVAILEDGTDIKEFSIPLVTLNTSKRRNLNAARLPPFSVPPAYGWRFVQSDL